MENTYNKHWYNEEYHSFKKINKEENNKNEEFKTESKKSGYKNKYRKYTHFLSIPLNYEPLQKEFIQWRDTILSSKFQGIHKRHFMGPHLIHVTLCMLPLEGEN